MPIRYRYLPALTSFERVRDAHTGYWDYQLPEEPGLVHIKRHYHRHNPIAPREPEYGTPPDYFTALCGYTVKVVLQQDVDLGDPDLCQACVSKALERQREYGDS